MVAVAVGQAIGVAAALGGSGEGFDFQLHQTLCGEADHLAQEVGVGGLLQQFSQVHVVAVIVGSLVRVDVRNQTLPKIRNDHRCG